MVVMLLEKKKRLRERAVTLLREKIDDLSLSLSLSLSQKMMKEHRGSLA